MAIVLGGCAGVYVHDPDLQTRTDAIDAAARAHPIDQAFAGQLAQLKDGDGQEALGVAHYMTAVRDRRVAEAAGYEAPADRSAAIQRMIKQRSGDLFVGDLPDDAIAKLADFPRALQDQEFKYADSKQAYLDFKTVYRGALTDLSCKAIHSDAPDLKTPLGRMQKACNNMTGAILTPAFGGKPGPVAAQAIADLADAEDSISEPEAQEIDSRIQKIIDDAAKSPDETEAVQKASDELVGVLKDANAVAALAGWTKLDAELSAFLQGYGCASSAPDAVTCANLKPATAAGQARGIVVFVKAIATLSDASRTGGKHGFALQAAKAIASAKKADAQARFDAAQQLLLVRKRRLIALAAEARYLAEAASELTVDQRHCGAQAADCALALYGLSWDRGRIPFTLLQFSEDDLTRETWVTRTRIAANEQEAVLTAATASLKAYGAGGIKPELVAQLLNAAGLGALAASH